MPPAYIVYPLGDNAITVDFGNKVDPVVNDEVLARYQQLLLSTVTGMTEVVPAYCTLTVFYHIPEVRKKAPSGFSAYEIISAELKEKFSITPPVVDREKKTVHIPVCYADEFAQDLHLLAAARNIPAAEIIKWHTSVAYRVYMIGFLPGFAYMGEVPEAITYPRKDQPVATKAGSVGIAGKQTGIYPMDSPGGWQIIGRTPLKIFTPESRELTLLKEGDTVQFYSIDSNEFAAMDQNK
jgi:inhibitor of KinA